MTRLSALTLGETDQIRAALQQAGLTAEMLKALALDPDTARLAVRHLQDNLDNQNPWAEPFGLYVGDNWRSLDGTDPGDIQVRTIDDGVQVRERNACRFNGTAGHATETCDNCWNSYRELQPSDQWRHVSGCIRIQVTSDVHDDRRRIIVSRRVSPGSPAQPEAEWSEPFSLQLSDDDWFDLLPEVQVSTNLTTGVGIIYRRATMYGADPAWTTPSYLAKSSHWADLAPGVQVRWTNSRGYDQDIEFRVATDYQAELAFEPTWVRADDRAYGTTFSGDHDCGHSQPSTAHGIAYEQLWTQYATCGYSPRGAKVTIQATGERLRLPQINNHWLRLTPGLRIKMADQGGAYAETATTEPVKTASQWSQPIKLAIDNNWTYIADGNIRIQMINVSTSPMFMVQKFESHDWVSYGRYNVCSSCAVAHELQPGVRVTFSAHRSAAIGRYEYVITVQYAVGAEEQSTEQPMTTLDPNETWQHVLPGLRIKFTSINAFGVDYAVWVPNRGVTDAPVGSQSRGSWAVGISRAPAPHDKYRWFNLTPGYEARLSPTHNALEIRAQQPEPASTNK